MSEYLQFVASKRPTVAPAGFEAHGLSDRLFPFQRRNVVWACRMGRAALFLDTGLGKTVQQLEWSRLVAEHTGRPVIILAPLAVAQQTVREAARFEISGAKYCRSSDEIGDSRLVVTNYERLDRFDPSVFGGVVLDESSILKSYSGPTKRAILAAFERTPYRLACTATPAPNDHLELGNHAEFLGIMSSHEMIARWFINDTSSFGTYRLKGHAVESFWDWVSSWAVMAGKPSDLGSYDDSGYLLPPLHVHRHVVDVDDVSDAETGQLFRSVALSATSVHAEKRRTTDARARMVADVIAREPAEQWLIWCETNYEADALRESLAGIIDCREVRGSEPPARKEESLMGFSDGAIPCLVTKPKIAGFGLNWQQCARVVFAGATYSFESWYQAIRRVWRYGQSRPVHVHAVMASTERGVWAVLERKIVEFDAMRSEMVQAAMRDRQSVADDGDYLPNQTMHLPTWLRAA